MIPTSLRIGISTSTKAQRMMLDRLLPHQPSPKYPHLTSSKLIIFNSAYHYSSHFDKWVGTNKPANITIEEFLHKYAKPLTTRRQQ